METSYTESNCPSMSPDIRNFGQAFIKAKREFNKTGKSGENAHQKYTYAKLEDIYNAVEDALLKNDIAIFHMREIIEGQSYLRTRLTHVLSGQYIQDLCLIQSEKPGNQAIGSALTYMKKYAVLSLCAIATEDDDGQDEEKYIEEHKRTVIDEEQKQELISTLQECTNSKELVNKICTTYKIKHLGELPSDSFERVLNYIIKHQQ